MGAVLLYKLLNYGYFEGYTIVFSCKKILIPNNKLYFKRIEMELTEKKLAGIDILAVRDALREFNDLPLNFDPNRDPMIIPKRLTVESIMTLLNIDSELAEEVQKKLIEKSYVDKEKLTPTEKGMALINYEDRERIAYEDASSLVQELVSKAKELNKEAELNGGRVFIECIKVFGSYQYKRENVGDIDLLIEFTSHIDVTPEDMEEEDELVEGLHFSEYFSFHNELGTYTLDIEPETIFQR